MPLQSNNNKETEKPFRIALITVVTQVGCITPVIILAALFLGIWLDDYLNTSPLFTISSVLVGAPISLIIVYLIARSATNRLSPEGVENKTPQTNEEDSNRGE